MKIQMNWLHGLIWMSFGLSYASQATELTSRFKDPSVIHPFASFILGADFIHTGQTQTVTLLPPFSNYYSANKSFQSSGSLGLATGIERLWNDEFSWQLGLSGYFNSPINSTGYVRQFTLPEFNNFSYIYSIQSKQLLITGKLLGTVKQTLHPYVSAELGAAFNRAYSYNETPLIDEAVPMAPFTNYTKTSLAWDVGFGIDIDINNSLRLGTGYQFANLGKASLGQSDAQLTQNTLGLSHLYTHQIRVQLTAFI